MKREDIEHLAALSRIKLEEAEKESLEKELSSIVDYVSVVTDIVSDEADAEPQVGVRHNIFRQDEVTNKPDEFTKEVINEMPGTHGRFLKVKKILKTE